MTMILHSVFSSAKLHKEVGYIHKEFYVGIIPFWNLENDNFFPNVLANSLYRNCLET